MSSCTYTNCTNKKKFQIQITKLLSVGRESKATVDYANTLVLILFDFLFQKKKKLNVKTYFTPVTVAFGVFHRKNDTFYRSNQIHPTTKFRKYTSLLSDTITYDN